MTERDKLAELIRDGQPISMSAEDIADAIIAAGWRAPEPTKGLLQILPPDHPLLRYKTWDDVPADDPWMTRFKPE